MNYLTDNEITKLIIEYINENIYEYAVMLDGDWGTGKSFYIKTKLIPEIEKGFQESGEVHRVVYVSLYGLKDTEEVTNQIYLKIVQFCLGKKVKFLPVVSAGVKALSEKFGLVSLGDIQPAKIFECFSNLQNYIFIFDDLERCSIPINEILGFINHLVEENSIKVVIVANQKEIGSLYVQKNLELKYLLACQDSIDFSSQDTKTSSSFITNVKTPQPKAITPKRLKERSEYLFEEDELYSQIREKLIGKIIYYSPQLSTVVPEIVNNCISNNAKAREIIISMIPLIESILYANEHHNIRTLQFSLLFYSKIFSLQNDKLINSRCRHQMLQDVFIATLHVSINYKKGNENYIWSEKSEYGLINLSKEAFDFIGMFQSFKFVHDYVYSSVFFEEYVIEVLVSYCQNLEDKLNSAEDPVNTLTCYWEKEDSFIEGALARLKQNFEENKYPATSYIWILSLIIRLKTIGFKIIDIEKMVENMKQNIISGCEDIQTFQEPIIKLEDYDYTEFKQNKDILLACRRDYRIGKRGFDINSIFENESGWGMKFYDYYSHNKNEIMGEKAYFANIDMNICIEHLDRAATKEMSDFRKSFATIYTISNARYYFHKDRDNIQKLKNHFDSVKYSEKTKEYNRNLFLGTLETVLSLLKVPSAEDI